MFHTVTGLTGEAVVPSQVIQAGRCHSHLTGETVVPSQLTQTGECWRSVSGLTGNAAALSQVTQWGGRCHSVTGHTVTGHRSRDVAVCSGYIHTWERGRKECGHRWGEDTVRGRMEVNGNVWMVSQGCFAGRHSLRHHSPGILWGNELILATILAGFCGERCCSAGLHINSLHP